MAGDSFVQGEQKIRPGTYVRITNVGEPPVTGAQGIVAAVIKAAWGPLDEPVTLESLEQVTTVFGTGRGTDVVREIFRGGAQSVKVVRVGKGGVVATLMLQDDTGADVAKLDTKYPTSRVFEVTLRDSLSNPNNRELLVYENTKLLEVVSFAKGDGEVDNFVSTVNQNSRYLSASKEGDGTALAAVTNKKLTNGSDPTATGEDYANAEGLLESERWNIIVTDSHDPSVHATLHTYVNRLRDGGKRVMGIVAEPTSVKFDTRAENSKAFNDPAILYVGNGFDSVNGKIEGAKAAGRAAGEILRSPYTSSLTHHVVSDAVDVVERLTNAQVEQAIESGMIVFTQNAAGAVQFEYGITTFTDPTEELDAGWKKIRRVRTRDTLMERVILQLDPLIGQINNNEDGRAAVVSIINGIINEMVAEGGLSGGEAAVDESNPASGDSAWFRVQVDDLDSLEKAYFTFGFRFAPGA